MHCVILSQGHHLEVMSFVCCMFNDLDISDKKSKAALQRAWDEDPILIITGEMKRSAQRLATVLQRCPNSLLVGPECAKQWHMDEQFDTMPQEMLQVFYKDGCPASTCVIKSPTWISVTTSILVQATLTKQYFRIFCEPHWIC